MDQALRRLTAVVLLLCSGALLRAQQGFMAQLLTAPTGLWSVVQSAQNDTCSTTANTGTFSCTVTLGSNTTTGYAGLFLATAYFLGTSISGWTWQTPTGPGTATACTSCSESNNYATDTFILTKGWYITSESSATTSVVFSTSLNSSFASCSTTSCGLTVAYIEFRKASGSVAYDTDNGSTTSSNCTSCTGPTLTLTGSDDYCGAWAAMNQVPSSIASPWTTPTLSGDTHNVEGIFGGAQNVLSWPGVTFTQSPTGAASMAAMCMK